MLARELLRVLAQVALDQVRREIADLVGTDTRSDQAELLEVASAGDLLFPEAGQDGAERAVERNREVGSEARAAVTEEGEPEPVLLDLLEPVETVDQPFIEVAVGRKVAQELQVPQDLLVQAW